MTAKIIFYKSSSKYYHNVCSQCSVFDSYTQNNSENIITTNLGEIRKSLADIQPIFSIIGRWSKTRCYFDGEEVPPQRLNLMMDILACEAKCHKCTINDEYCYGKTGWGCRFANSITLCHEAGTPSEADWYEFGNFFDGIWTIDKDWLFEKIFNEVKDKHIGICACFSLKRIENTIKRLPDQIIITDDDECEWEYKYRDAPIGMKPTEKIGVKPREKPSFSLCSVYDVCAPLYDELIDKLRAYVEGKEPSPEKDQLMQLIVLLEMITKQQIHMEKGQFSGFLFLMECHPWLFESVMGTILSWLISYS
jgi:hypothetical protein